MYIFVKHHSFVTIWRNIFLFTFRNLLLKICYFRQIRSMGSIPPELTLAERMEDLVLGGKFKVLPSTDQIKELQTIIRDKATSRSDFKFVADRLIRMVIEEGLNQLPYTSCEVTTPTGCSYSGLRYWYNNNNGIIGSRLVSYLGKILNKEVTKEKNVEKHIF